MAEYPEYQDRDEYYDEPSGNNRTWLVVAIVIVVVLLCCCCVALVAGVAVFNEDISRWLVSNAGAVPNLVGVTASV